MELAVIDASVAAKWILTEPQTGAALDLLQQPLRCVAPAIVQVEVAGAVIRRYRSGLLPLDEARTTCDEWRSLAQQVFARLVPSDELYETAVELSLRMKHPLADCLYLAVARQLECRLITADRALHERGRLVHEQVSLLAQAA